ncbi:type 4 fimbrial biogenesis protein PilE [Ammonifex degensii KC4]|uniref:Type 4 fimbrial biogenesis protein PilE n=1 Tax=Ammonifex degensii (strain DSM 10501 / KC4) TaxID=429009 RepID=C9R935_AMMDK|nr:prepilin-type N-terminal cleavage/methylation domain-containing protein [Ammonifex degensii]ACX52814.1 type 4 fimbrial biogenesis protein PilE [Ammonifex degensii KC4]
MPFYKLCRHLYRKGQDERGFTMVEMMVVLIIIAVLIGVGIWLYLGYVEKARITKAESFLTSAAGALDAYYAQYGTYPSADDLDTAGVYLKDNKGNDIKDPWGGTYKYTGTGGDTYTLETTGGTKVNVQATGNKGVSEIKVVKK